MKEFRQLPFPTKIEDPDLTFDLGVMQHASADFFKSGSVFSELWSIKRYINPDGTPIPMIHRPDLALHTTRVGRLSHDLGTILERSGTSINFRRLKHVAEAHDMAEIVTGDIISPFKERMTNEQKVLLAQLEDEGIIKVAERYYPLHLRQMLIGHFREAREKKTTEAQLVKIADVWDGMSEALNEIRCGNEKEFLPIFANWKRRMGWLDRLPIWETLKSDPTLGFLPFLSQEEAGSLPKISIKTYEVEGREAFWQEVLRPDIPPWHRHWLSTSLLGFNRVGTAIFPGWKKELSAEQPTLQILYQHNGHAAS